MISRLVTTAAGLDDVEQDAVGSGGAADATADAGDEVAGEQGAGEGAEENVGYSGDSVAMAGNKVSKLLARGLAAKEADGKVMAPSQAAAQSEAARKAATRRNQTGETADEGDDDGGMEM